MFKYLSGKDERESPRSARLLCLQAPGPSTRQQAIVVDITPEEKTAIPTLSFLRPFRGGGATRRGRFPEEDQTSLSPPSAPEAPGRTPGET